MLHATVIHATCVAKKIVARCIKGVTRSERHLTCRNVLQKVEPDSTCRATCDFKKSVA